MKSLRYYYKKIVRPYGKSHFLSTYVGKKQAKILDVGCGNNSVRLVKRNCTDCYYIGVDVGDYNLAEELKKQMDEYHVVTAENFADKIREVGADMDVVISAHNIEHCNEPLKVLKNMIMSLKRGGHLYLAFPTENSVEFPHRDGTLNFYDDPTHIWCPKWNEIMKILAENNVQIDYACKNHTSFLLRTVGRFNERKSKYEKKVLRGTWEYYGFESIIWGTLRE